MGSLSRALALLSLAFFEYVYADLTHAQTHAHSFAYVQHGKGAFDHAKEIRDEEKRAAVLARMAECSVLCAVATGRADLVAEAVAKGCNMNETDVEENSCLHLAATQGSIDILQILLQAGANVAAKNQAGNTSVWLAMEQEHEAAVEVLLQAGQLRTPTATGNAGHHGRWHSH